MIKKQYIQPSIKAYKIHTASILAGSTVSSGGSNSNGPVTAESKSGFDLGFGLDEDEE